MPDDVDDLDDLLDEFTDNILLAPVPKPVPLEEPNDLSIQDLIADLDIKDPETMAQLQELASQFTPKPPVDSKKDIKLETKPKAPAFDSVMKETVERLHKREQSLDDDLDSATAASNPQNLLALLLAGKDGDDGDMLNLLVEMLEQLLSKEVLYEPIKDLNTKYPEWLKENESKLSAEDSTKYNKQYALTNEILAVFDDPQYSDDDTAKRDEINALLESLQDLGQPPKDIVGEDGDLPGFDAFGGDKDFDFSDKDLPPGFEKEIEENCKQT